MKTLFLPRIILVFLCILSFGLYSCNDTQTTNHQDLKVLAWNVWHGGHSINYPEIGCENVIGILKHSNADVILMIETYGAAPMVADSLGFYYELLSDNLSIYSRYPITKKYTFPKEISTFNFGGVEIDMNGTPVRLFDTWLHYLPDMRIEPVHLSEKEILAWDDDGTRDEEVRAILSTIKPFIDEADSIPVIMGGDFNGHSHLDWTEATKDLYRHGGAVVNWTVSQEMVKHGFIDSFREMNPDPVKRLGETWIYDVSEEGEEEPPTRLDRIDYIYYKGNTIEAISSDSYNAILGETLNFEGKDFIYTSDHGFVVTTFKIKK